MKKSPLDPLPPITQQAKVELYTFSKIPFEILIQQQSLECKASIDWTSLPTYSQTIPESIGHLTALNQLGLAYNQLTTLPESIGHLTALNQLVLQNNQLTTLPESIGHLTALNQLSLQNNQLTTLPESIGHLTALSYFSVDQNPFTKVSEPCFQLNSLIEMCGFVILQMPQNTEIDSLPIPQELKERLLNRKQCSSCYHFYIGQPFASQIYQKTTCDVTFPVKQLFCSPSCWMKHGQQQ